MVARIRHAAVGRVKRHATRSRDEDLAREELVEIGASLRRRSAEVRAGQPVVQDGVGDELGVERDCSLCSRDRELAKERERGHRRNDDGDRREDTEAEEKPRRPGCASDHRHPAFIGPTGAGLDRPHRDAVERVGLDERASVQSLFMRA
jgi:hypothetical protein